MIGNLGATFPRQMVDPVAKGSGRTGLITTFKRHLDCFRDRKCLEDHEPDKMDKLD